MNSFETFVEIFERCRKERNNNDLTFILKDSRRYFQNLSTSDIGLVMSILFEENRGLLDFLNKELDRYVSDKSFESSIMEGFRLLEFIIDQFYKFIGPYAVKVKSICQFAIVTTCSLYIKGVASVAFEKLISHCSSAEMDLNESVKEFVTKFQFNNVKGRTRVLKALGSIAKYCPEAISPTDSNLIFRTLMSDFKQQYKPIGDAQPSELGVYLDVISNMLNAFPPCTESTEKSEAYLKDLYTYVMKLSSVPEDQHRKVVNRAAIALLEEHMSFFTQAVYNDLLFWHETLLHWLRQKNENKTTGFNALSRLYKTMGSVLQEKKNEEGQRVFEYLMKFFKDSLMSSEMDTLSIRLVIRGFGQMAGPCKKYLTENDVREMYSLIARRAMVSFSSENEVGLFQDIADHQVSLSEMMPHMSEVSADQMNTLIKLSTVLVKRFPEIPVTSHSRVVVSLRQTIMNLRNIQVSLYQEFIQKTVYEGIIWTCSHTLLIDADLQRETQNLSERPITYKNYLPLWRQLLSPGKMTKDALQQIFDEVIRTCIAMTDKLDLRTRVKEDNIFSNVAASQVAVNDTDFHVFINLVDLFVDIFERLESALMEDWIHRFLYNMIKKSYNSPLISGFYKLVHSAIKISDIFREWEKLTISNQETFDLVSQYVSDTLDLVGGFSGELQIACLNLILDTPVFIIKSMLDRTATVFMAAFTMGQSNFSVAQSALFALEKWSRELDKEESREFLIEVVPSLEPFLQSRESTAELKQEILQSERKVITKVTLTDREKTLEEFQRRILLFLGSLDSAITLNFVHKRSLDTGASWDKKNLLEYTLPYKDVRPVVSLDKILPRVIELALHSSDRRTRVVACEVLHSFFIFMLGKTVQKFSSKPEHYIPLFKKLCPALLRLGCDSDQITQQLFYPLVIQLTHWLASKMMLRSYETGFLIQTLFDNLTDESDSAFRDFSGVCLAEFVTWAIKQSTDAELKNSPTNILAIVRQITSFSLHPSTQKRTAAAIAFNHLYAILRQRKDIVNAIWMELLFCFVKSLEGCGNLQIVNALKNVKEEFSNRSDMFNQASSRRRKPAEFQGTLLKDAVYWLLSQCGSLDQTCRTESMKMYGALSPLVRTDHDETVMSTFLKDEGLQGLNSIILRGLSPKMHTISLDVLQPILKTVDCYIWLVTEELISFELLFKYESQNEGVFFDCVRNFIHLLMCVKEEKDGDSLKSMRELVKLNTTKCEIIVRLFDLIRILPVATVETGRDKSTCIPKSFWCEELFSLISACVLKPQKVGFEMRNMRITESLPAKMEKLLNTLKEKLNPYHMGMLKTALAKDVESKYTNFSDIHAIVNNGPTIELKYYLKGLILLRKCNLLEELNEGAYIDGHLENKITNIFNILKTEQFGRAECINLKPDTMEYLGHLMEFLLLNCELKVIETLVNFTATSTSLYHHETKISHGEYFFLLFKKAIFQNMFRNIKESVGILLSHALQDKSDIVLTIVEELVKFSQKRKKDYEEFMIPLQIELIDKCSFFQQVINNYEHRKEKVIHMYAILVTLMQNPSYVCRERGELYHWILRELTGNVDLAYKTLILRHFLICLTDATLDKNPELTQCFNRLKADHYATSLSQLPRGSLIHSNIVAHFHVLLESLLTTKSIVVFECIINFAAGDAKHLCTVEVDEYLNKYFKSLLKEHALKSLEIAFECFMYQTSSEVRFDVLNKFLLPSIQFCELSAIEEFFENVISQVYQIISQALIGNDMDVKRLIVSKIGCYNLVEIMFARLPTEKLTSADSRITRNAINEVKTGRELLSALCKSFLNVRQLKYGNIENREIMRQLHCAAYNCCIALVSLKNDDNFYLVAFREDRPNNRCIWENIVDSEVRYEFPQSMKELPKERQKLVNIRHQARDRSDIRGQKNSYVQTYSFVSSTLNEDISAYDLKDANLSESISAGTYMGEAMVLTLESDDLNDHECMASICGIITHMISAYISPHSKQDGDLVCPKWLTQFLASMNVSENRNASLFMLKVILNTQTVLKPFAKFILKPVLNTVNSHLFSCKQIDRLITDTLIMLVDWHTLAIPTNHDEIVLAQRLLYLLVNTAHNDQKNVHKYNIEIIRMVVEIWKTCLNLPDQFSKTIIHFPSLAIQLIRIFLTYGMYEQVMANVESLEYLKRSATNLELDEESILNVFGSLGLVLHFLGSSEDSEGEKGAITTIVKTAFRQMQRQHENRLIKCIYAMHKHYPDIADIFLPYVINGVMRVDESNRAKCMEIFLSVIPRQTEEEVIRELGYMKFQNVLKNKISSCERVALLIVEKLTTVLKPSELLPLASLVSMYVKDVSLEYREIAYGIFMAVNERYCKDITDDNSVRQLKDLSRKILLAGLLDANEGLQQKLLKFWTEDKNLTENSVERLLEVLDMYHVEVENTYLPILPLIMLHLASKAPDFEKKLFEPLSDCRFQDYHMAVLWRSKNVGSMAPLFTPSLANQMNSTFTLMSQSSSQQSQTLNKLSAFSNQGTNVICATQSQQFQHTVAEEHSLPQFLLQNTSVIDETFKVPKIPQPTHNKKSKRFLVDPTDVSNIMRNREIKRNVRREEMMREEVVRQRSSIKMYRKYRIGDFPDTEITHSSMIIPLQELAKKDQLIAKDLMVCLFCSLANELTPQNKSVFLKKASRSLNFILENGLGTNPVVATVLEIILCSRGIDVCSNVVAKVSKSSGLLSLGALLLEEKLIYGSLAENSGPPAKRTCKENSISDDLNQWIQLSSLYESMNEVDVVMNIFASQVPGNALQEASFAQTAREWDRAKKAYEEALLTEKGSIEEHCLEGLYKCMAYLSSWENINVKITEKLNSNFDVVWDASFESRWIIPWIFQAQLRMMLDGEGSDAFINIILNNWLSDKEKLSRIKGPYGEEMAMFFVHQDLEVSRDYLISGLEVIRQQWVILNPLSAKLRASKLLKLRGFNDVSMYLEALIDKDNILSNAKSLMRYWKRSLPSKQDDLLLWDTQVAYRLHFALSIVDQLEDDNSEMLNMAHSVSLEQRLSLIEVALSQGNIHLMRKHLECSRDMIEIDNCPRYLRNQWMLAFAKWKHLRAKMNDKRKTKDYLLSWKKSHDLLDEDGVDSKIEIATRQHISLLANEMGLLVMESDDFAEAVKKDEAVIRKISDTQDRERIVVQLNAYSLANLKKCHHIGDGQSIGECYLRTAVYCHSRITKCAANKELSQEFVRSTLRAMSHGAIEAAQYFPCLLQLEHLQITEVQQTFESESKNVQTWMFLAWQAQLMSHIGTPVHTAVAPILKRLAEIYPEAIMYSFRLTKEMNPAIVDCPLVVELSDCLLNKIPAVETLLQALQYVVQPELYLKYHLEELYKNLSLGKSTAVDILLNKVYPPSMRDRKGPIQGEVYKEIASFREKVKRIENMMDDKIGQYICQLLNKLRELLSDRKERLKLKDYSPWLENVISGEIEIPGQYTGDRKPMPRYHAKIMKFEQNVTVMRSIRKPISITMLGNDAKSYKFLVKFGEDLRQDQRLQQLFTLMNKILQTDTSCRERQLSIDTYEVIPLTSALGLIQWVDNTRSLREFVTFTLNDQQKEKLETMKLAYNEWMRKHSSAKEKAAHVYYREAVLRYTDRDVTNKFNEIKSRMKWDLLRRALKAISSSPESFFTLRHNFVITYATMCIAHWILGVGDRHLANTLISTGSGRCLGIDFGLAFGAGTNLQVPELVPFRLTPQILGLLQPFDENGLLRATMTRVLRALKNEQKILMACMEVFVQEPSLDWLNQARKKSGEDRKDFADMEWLPKQKIAIALQKLNGVKPSKVTLTELKDSHAQYRDCFAKYTTIVEGTDSKKVRATMKDENLSPEDQVRCLLDQATDANILGRAYSGWEPWL